MSNKNKKNKNKNKEPLHKADKLVYNILFVLIFLFPFICIICRHFLVEAIAYNHSNVAIYATKFSFFAFFAPLLTFLVSLCATLSRFYDGKSILFCKNKKKTRTNIFFIIVIAFFIIIWILNIGTLYKRYEINDDSLVSYGMFNVVKDEYSISDVERITISFHKSGNGPHFLKKYQNLNYTVYTKNGNEFVFSPKINDFLNLHNSQFANIENVELLNAEHLDEYINYYNLSEKEKNILFNLLQQ